MENEWPPILVCAQYRLGFLPLHITRKDWEDLPDLYDSVMFDKGPSPPLFGGNGIEPNWEHNTVGRAKMYLRQIRTSRGYDVDCKPPASLQNTFHLTALDVNRLTVDHAEMVRKESELAIRYIEWKTGKRYEFVSLVKAVWTGRLGHLLTFTARETGSGGDPQTFLATVRVSLDRVSDQVVKCYHVLECLLKPQGPPPESQYY